MNTQISNINAANPVRGTASILSRSLFQLRNLVEHIDRSLATRRHRKMAIAHLMHLDDAMLRDIGITRGDTALMVSGRTREHLILPAHGTQ